MLTPVCSYHYTPHPVFADRISRLDVPAFGLNFAALDLLFPGLYNPMFSDLMEIKDSVLVGAHK